MAAKVYNYFILTGEPGVGKTTLLKNLASDVALKGKNVTGFYTQEIRSHDKKRMGFDVISCTDGNLRGRLARDGSLLNRPSKVRVGKYEVFVEEFEQVALAIMDMANSTQLDLLAIDEIGKMELFSKPFENAVKKLFNTTPNYSVITTIPQHSRHPLIEHIRNDKRSKLWTVTRENRNTIHDEILAEMNKTMHFM